MSRHRQGPAGGLCEGVRQADSRRAGRYRQAMRASAAGREAAGVPAPAARIRQGARVMNILMFHLMPYADLDVAEAKKYPTVWTALPNSFYDPKKGAALYNRYLDELEYGEKLGFDGLCVNEHHQTAYGLMPSPIVTASA